MINRDHKTRRKKANFFLDPLQHTGDIESDLTKTKKNIAYEALVSTLKNKKNTQDFLQIFSDFFQIWKIAGQMSRLFQQFKTLYEPHR